MPYNGSGVYTLPSNSFNPAVANTEIDATDWNASADDLETALSSVITKDGQTTTTASIPFAAGVTINNTGLKVFDTNASHTLAFVPGSDLSANRTLTLTTGDANRTISMAGNLTFAGSITSSGAFPITLTATAATSVTLPTSGTLLSTGSPSAYVASITGTANEITASAATGAVTLSLPSALTFTGKTITGGSYVTPALGAATATSLAVNGATLGSGSTLVDLAATSAMITNASLPAELALVNTSGASNAKRTVIKGGGGTLYVSFESDSGATILDWLTATGGSSTTYPDLVLRAPTFGLPNTSAFKIYDTTNPAFFVSATGDGDAGVKITATTAGSGAAIAAISSGTNENLTIDAKGSGTITLGGTSTGNIVLSRTLSGAAASFSGTMSVSQASGNGVFTIGNRSSNSSSIIDLLSSNSATNWRIRTNDAAAGDITFTPSTAGGGNTFTTPAMSIGATGGLQMGAPTGGDKGAGTINVAADIYKNNTAYTNPDYVLEHWATGDIVKYADKPGASGYTGLAPLPVLRDFVRANLHLPHFGQDAGHGLFSGSDAALASIEEAYLYIFQLEDRVARLERG